MDKTIEICKISEHEVKREKNQESVIVMAPHAVVSLYWTGFVPCQTSSEEKALVTCSTA